jgi:hypothetical protein
MARPLSTDKSAERRRAKREILRKTPPCLRCSGIEFQLSREVYLDAFRLLVCAGCGHTEWLADDPDMLLRRGEFQRISVKVPNPYR